VVTQGASFATVEGHTLTLSPDADRSHFIEVVAEAGKVRSAPVSVPVSTVQPTDLTVEVSATTLRKGDSAAIDVTVYPQNATIEAQLSLVRNAYTQQYVSLGEDNIVWVSADAVEGAFSVQCTAGTVTKTVDFVVEKTPVTMVTYVRLYAADDRLNMVRKGDEIVTACRVYPIDATYRQVTYTVTDGAEYVEYLGDGDYRVTTDKIGVSIVLAATADGKTCEMWLTTVPIEAEQISVTTSGTTSVRDGDERRLSVTVTPADAVGEVALSISEGGSYCTLTDGVLRFDAKDGLNHRVVVKAAIGDVVDYLTFFIEPEPVSGIYLSTNDPTVGLRAGESVCLEVEIRPQNASNKVPTFVIEQGAAFGSLTGNVFTAAETDVDGTVIVVAEVDGVVSNRLAIEVVADAYRPTYTLWSELDANPQLFGDHRVVVLDLRALPYAADECVVVVNDNVDVLTIVGNYDGATGDTCYRNLYFDFLTTDAITVHLKNVGIIIDNGFTDTVLDFGGEAKVTLVSENDNFIRAGDAYALSTDGFMITDASPDRLMDGMDGFAGQNGGNALCAYEVTLSGSGRLTLAGGDASSGTDGTDGLSTSDSATYAGNGGWGGSGGVGGYAIYAVRVNYDFEGDVYLSAGASATAGKGGAAGKGVTAAKDGASGIDGADGEAHGAVHVVDGAEYTYQGVPVKTMGASGRVWLTARPFDSALAAAALLSRHYKVNVYYDAGYHSGYETSYKMVKFDADNDEAEIVRMLHGLDYALQVFGHKVMIELAGKHKVNYYLCKSITRSGNTIYGLTDSANNVWYSSFDTRKRDLSLYSTYYNIMVHEVFHVLYFSASESTKDRMSISRLRTYNRNMVYNDQVLDGVYNSDADNGMTACFLTKYSKVDNREDISETLSIMCVQPQARSFCNKQSYISTKAIYLTNLFTAEYASLDGWKQMAWLRFVR
jgi:hypothetical protein